MEDTEDLQSPTIFDKRTPCDWPWKALTLDCNKNINPCCEYSVFSTKSPYGKIEETTNLNKLWKDQNLIKE